eukprot:6464049-Amphidinium_carterae.3
MAMHLEAREDGASAEIREWEKNNFEAVSEFCQKAVECVRDKVIASMVKDINTQITKLKPLSLGGADGNSWVAGDGAALDGLKADAAPHLKNAKTLLTAFSSLQQVFSSVCDILWLGP